MEYMQVPTIPGEPLGIRPSPICASTLNTALIQVAVPVSDGIPISVALPNYPRVKPAFPSLHAPITWSCPWAPHVVIPPSMPSSSKTPQAPPPFPSYVADNQAVLNALNALHDTYCAQLDLKLQHNANHLQFVCDTHNQILHKLDSLETKLEIIDQYHSQFSRDFIELQDAFAQQRGDLFELSDRVNKVLEDEGVDLDYKANRADSEGERDDPSVGSGKSGADGGDAMSD